MSTQTAQPPTVDDDPAPTSAAGPAPSGRRRSRVLLTVTGAVVAVLFVLPLWWTIASALRPQQETFRTLSPVTLWTVVPRSLTFENFVRLFDGDFGRAMLNSVIVTVATLVIGLTLSATAAFAISSQLRFNTGPNI